MVIIIPIEGFARESEKAVTLATYLRYYLRLTVIVAYQSVARSIALRFGSNAIFIGKHFFAATNSEVTDIFCLRQLLEAGCKIVYIDEEGGLFLRDDLSRSDNYSLLAPRYPFLSPVLSAYSDQVHILHWGEYQSSLVSSLLPTFKNSISGAPFVDTAKILNLSPYNLSSDRRLPVYSWTQSASLITATSPLYGSSSWFHRLTELCQDDFVFSSSRACNELLQIFTFFSVTERYTGSLLSKWRPHPSARSKESISLVSHIVSKYGGASLSRPMLEPIYKYIQSADVFFHAGCTTSIQCNLLGKPTIYLRSSLPGRSRHLLGEHEICSESSPILPQISDFIDNYSGQPNDSVGFSEISFATLANLSSADLLSYRSILSAVSDFIPDHSDRNSIDDELDKLSTFVISSYSRYFYGKLVKRAFSLPRLSSPARRLDRLSYKFGLLKFSSFSSLDVDHLVSAAHRYISTFENKFDVPSTFSVDRCLDILVFRS